MKDIAFAFDANDGRRIVVGLDVKGVCAPPSESRAMLLNLGARRELARFLRPARDFVADTSTSTEYETMPNHDRRRTPAGRRATDGRRARDMLGDMDPVEAIESLIGELSEQEAEELLDRLGSDRRRLGRDNPPPFPGRPNPGGELDPLEKYRLPGETREHAQDRRRFALDEMSDRHGYGQKAFFERFPSAAKIRLAP